MKKLKFLFILNLFYTLSLFSQDNSPIIYFLDTIHHFGNITDSNTPYLYQFKFTNTGQKELLIKNIQLPKGCYSPKWSQNGIQNRDSGFVEIRFNPENTIENFSKSITIYSNAINSPSKIKITGTINKPTENIEDSYPYKIGKLRTKTKQIDFDSILNTESQTKTLYFYNPTQKKVSVVFNKPPSFIELDKINFEINPLEITSVKIKYKAYKNKNWGAVHDAVNIIIDYDRGALEFINVTADIHEDFSTLSTEDSINAPRFVIPKTEFDIGNIKEGVKKKYRIEITNSGNSDLIIRKIKSSCKCTRVRISKKIIKPKGTTQIKIKFNSKGKSGKQHKNISIITNDPLNSRIQLSFRGNILP